MSADILLFPLTGKTRVPDNFRKALVSIAVLLDFNAEEASEIITAWVSECLISDDEADALREFYGWKPSHLPWQ